MGSNPGLYVPAGTKRLARGGRRRLVIATAAVHALSNAVFDLAKHELATRPIRTTGKQPCSSGLQPAMQTGDIIAQRNTTDGDPVAIDPRNLTIRNVPQPPRGDRQAIDGGAVEWRS